MDASSPARPVVVVLGHAVRALAEAAVRDGYDVIALDLYGDVDTRRACLQWHAAGRPGDARIDPERAQVAIAAAARAPGVIGLIAAGGCEAVPDLLDAAVDHLPLLGMPVAHVRRLRDPRRFFACLDAAGIDHPPVRWTVPGEAGWLHKDAAGTGGWQVRRVAPDAPTPLHEGSYFQRESAGAAWSATCLATAAGVQVLGLNELLVRAFGARPYVYAGAIGPAPLAAWPAPSVEALQRALAALHAEFGLVGLCGLDVLLDGDNIAVLELNPRPTATLALYAAAPRHGLLRAHVDACQGRTPVVSAGIDATWPLRGQRVVYARRALTLSARAARWLDEQPDLHDCPAPGTAIAAGDPVCSVESSVGPPHASAPLLRLQLKERRRQVLDTLETSS